MTSVARICSIEGCELPHEARDLCRLHYRRRQSGLRPDGTRPAVPCSVEGCERPVRSRGHCASHYKSRIYTTRENPSRTCTRIPGCDRPHHAKGLCYKHYLRDWAGTDTPEVDNTRYAGRGCFVNGCPNPAGGQKGLCKSHVNWAGKYGLSVLQTVQILNSPYTCDVCGRDLEGGRHINVDHDHSCCPGQGTCGKCVRGLLCRACNRAIGSFGEDAETLKHAVTYLTGIPL